MSYLLSKNMRQNLAIANYEIAEREVISQKLASNLREKEILLKEIEQVPEPYLDEVLDFIRFLKTKNIKEKMHITIASEISLTKDWLKPEEDEAWQNL